MTLKVIGLNKTVFDGMITVLIIINIKKCARAYSFLDLDFSLT